MPIPLSKIHRYGIKNVGLQPKNRKKTGNFGYKFAQRGRVRVRVNPNLTMTLTLTLKRLFYTKFGIGRESQVRTLTPNVTVVALKMWVYSSQNRRKW